MTHLPILFPPFNLVVTTPADAHIWRGKDLVSLLTLRVVPEREGVLVLGSPALLLLFRPARRRHPF